MPQRSRQRRASAKRRPHRQGDLDSLCGVYSVVNAVRALCPELTAQLSARLFEHLMKALTKAGASLAGVVCDGIGLGQLRKLLHVACAFVARHIGVQLRGHRLPVTTRERSSIEGVWRCLVATLASGSVAIIGLGGRVSHWVVATAGSRRSLRLFDSGVRRRLWRRHCTVRDTRLHIRLAPGEITCLERASA